MNKPTPHGDVTTRRMGLWAAVLGLAAVAMSLLPLVSLLGYESSFVLGLLISAAAAHLGGLQVKQRRAMMMDPARTNMGIHGAALRLTGATVLRCWLLLLLPVGVLLLNALRVKNCNLWAGLGWVLVLPGISAVTGASAGVCCGLALTHERRALLAAWGVIIVSLLWGLYRFYMTPAIHAYDPFAGYFPGSLYDEEVAITGTLMLGRALHLWFALTALSWATWLLDENALVLRAARGTARGRLAVVTLGVTMMALAGFWLEPRLGLCPDAASIAQALGGRHETAHLVLIYGTRGPFAKEIARHAADAEFRFSQLTRFFGVTPQQKITCFLFADAAEKRRYTGAGHTQIAKPWRREIYIQYGGWPHPVLKHELAHIVAGEFGDRWFRIARRGVQVSMGLVEGAAVAAEGDARPERLSLDQSVKVMRTLGLEPPLGAVLGTGFYAYSAARAYTLAGSFVRFLIDAHGVARFRTLYQSGGDFLHAYGVTLASLEAAWRQRIDAVSVSRWDQALSEERLRRPGVLHKVCAHELAVRTERAGELLLRGESAAAAAIYASLCHDDPDDPEPRLRLMDANLRAGQLELARKNAVAVLEHPKASTGQRVRALVFLGDREVFRGDLAAAAAAYGRALVIPLDEATARNVRVRLWATDDGPLGRALRRYLYGPKPGADPDPALLVLRAREVMDAAPNQGIGAYLLGRQLAAHEQHLEAADLLARSLALGLPDPGFVVEARRLSAREAYLAGELGRARAVFAALAEGAEVPHEVQAEARDFIERCDMERQRGNSKT